MFEMREGDRVVTKKNPNGFVNRYVLDEYGKPVAKKCTGCLKIKEIERFSKNNANKFHGREPRCKICNKQHYEENKELAKKYYTENKELIAEYSRKYYTENKERLAERQKKHRAERSRKKKSE